MSTSTGTQPRIVHDGVRVLAYIPGGTLTTTTTPYTIFEGTVPQIQAEIANLGLIPPEEFNAADEEITTEQAKEMYLKLNNSIGTQTQRLQRLEKVMAWIIKDRFSV